MNPPNPSAEERPRPDQIPGSSPSAETPATDGKIAIAPGSHEQKILEFLYDKRLTLFNYRRDIEWKVFFGAVTIYAGIDAALLSQRIALAGLPLYLWWGLCVLLLLLCIDFNVQIQQRNKTDRLAMDEIQTALCDASRLPKASSIREVVEKPHGSSAETKPSALYAFRGQITVLALICAIFMYLPFVLQPAQPQGSKDAPANSALQPAAGATGTAAQPDSAPAPAAADREPR